MTQLQLYQGILIFAWAKILITQITGEKNSYTFTSFWKVSETIGDQKPYSTEMDGEDLLLIICVELEKDQNNLFLLVASATADN